MKFEDYLMQQSDDKQKRLDLEKEVENLRVELEEEEARNKVLHCALHGPASAHPCLASLLPPQVQGLLAELAMVEEEIIWLERRVDELKLSLYQERKLTEKWILQRKQRRKLRQLPPCRPGNPSLALDDESSQPSRSQHFEEYKKDKMKFKRSSIGSAEEMSYLFSTSDEISRGRMQKEHYVYQEICDEKPNSLSEELIRCLIGIFLDVNQAPQSTEGLAIVPKLSLSCINPKSSKPSFSCKASVFAFDHNTLNLDPYCIMPDSDSTIRDIGQYKNFIQIARSTLDVRRFSECLPLARKMRFLTGFRRTWLFFQSLGFSPFAAMPH